MRKLKLSAACLILSGSLICSSCIGSFGLWSSLKDWNNNIGNKFVNEIVFLAFHIVPVYEVAYLADIIVLNSIEFWSGSNPLAENIGTVKTIKGENGESYNVANQSTYISIAEMAEFLKTRFNSTIDVRIEQHPEMGYAPITKLRLSTEKLNGLGWTPKIGLEEMYKRLLASFKYA